MAKEYIEREAALAFPFANGNYDHDNANEHFIFGCESYKEWIEQIPTADVVPVKHGKWCEVENGESGHLCECSACKEWLLFYYGFVANYCPNCGARMDGDYNG